LNNSSLIYTLKLFIYYDAIDKMLLHSLHRYSNSTVIITQISKHMKKYVLSSLKDILFSAVEFPIL